MSHICRRKKLDDFSAENLTKITTNVKKENQKLKRHIALISGNQRIRVEEEELFRKQSDAHLDVVSRTCLYSICNKHSHTSDAAIESKDGQVSTPGTPNLIKNCKIVRVFSCYSGTNPGPSNTQSPDQHQEIRSSQNPRSTEETEEYAIWYPNGSSAPFFSQEMSSQATFDHDQPAKFPARLLLYPSRGVLLGGQSFLDVNRYMIKINYGADIGEFQCVICGKIVS